MGTIAAILVSVSITNQQHKKQRELDYERESRQKERDEEKENIEIQNMLSALRAEMTVFLEIFNKSIISRVHQTKAGEPFAVKYYGRGEPFHIYKTSQSRIEKLKDAELRTQIITTYMYAFSLIQVFYANNDFIDEYARLHELIVITKNEAYRPFYDALIERWLASNEKMKESYGKLVGHVEALLKLLPQVKLSN